MIGEYSLSWWKYDCKDEGKLKHVQETRVIPSYIRIKGYENKSKNGVSISECGVHRSKP